MKKRKKKQEVVLSPTFGNATFTRKGRVDGGVRERERKKKEEKAGLAWVSGAWWGIWISHQGRVARPQPPRSCRLRGPRLRWGGLTLAQVNKRVKSQTPAGPESLKGTRTCARASWNTDTALWLVSPPCHVMSVQDRCTDKERGERA